jgi:hypothetical protein
VEPGRRFVLRPAGRAAAAAVVAQGRPAPRPHPAGTGSGPVLAVVEEHLHRIDPLPA